MSNDSISRQAAIEAIDDWWITVDDNRHPVDVIKALPSASSEIVRCEECVYRRRCMLQHFVESNAVDGKPIDWSEWYCADGVWDINVPRKSDGKREE